MQHKDVSDALSVPMITLDERLCVQMHSARMQVRGIRVFMFKNRIL